MDDKNIIKNASKSYRDVKALDNISLDAIRALVNVSPQESAIALNLTVYENLELFEHLYGINDKLYLNEVMALFNLEKFKNKRAKTLS